MMSAFCDGTVRAVGFNVSAASFYRMCSINDGGTFELPDE